MSVFPPSGISGPSFESPFLSPLLFFCLVLLLFLSCHFLIMVHSPDFFPKFLKIKFVKILDEQPGWYWYVVILADFVHTIWHWYLHKCIKLYTPPTTTSFFLATVFKVCDKLHVGTTDGQVWPRNMGRWLDIIIHTVLGFYVVSCTECCFHACTIYDFCQ